MSDVPAPTNACRRLRLATQARIGLGRSGDGLPTTPLLDFQMAHAMARDAVHAGLSEEAIRRDWPHALVGLSSRAPDRQTYLQRPDLGRRLDADSRARLESLDVRSCDAVIILADGLSATAAHTHGPQVAKAVADRLSDWRIAPLVVAHQARVALADEIGELLGARFSIMLVGERPGLSSPDSLGAYLTWQPRIGRMDSERNCVSNIRPPHGLSHAAAADTIAWLARAARACGATGIALKDDSGLDHGRIGAPQA
jgi:ethanolamine ammonia-lyase small subunit